MSGMFTNRLILGCGLAIFWFLIFVAPPAVNSHPPAESDTDSARDQALDAERGSTGVAIDHLLVGAPVSYGNLTLFPLFSTLPQQQDRFLTLDEGLQSGVVEITEVGPPPGSPQQAAAKAPCDCEEPVEMSAAPASSSPHNPTSAVNASSKVSGTASIADVNHLLVNNRSRQALYLMPGELFSGGKQDRVLAHEVVVPPGAERMPIEVFCVEHGRWAGRPNTATAELASTLASNAAANARAQGEFPTSGANVGKRVRRSANGDTLEAQSRVWEEVAAINGASGAKSDSDAFAANYTQSEIVAKLKPFQERLASVADAAQVVGVIVAINGRPDSADWFESTVLFRKLWPKLLKSYALDAAIASPLEPAAPCSMADACLFLAKATSAKTATPKLGAGLATTRGDAADVVSFSACERLDQAMGNRQPRAGRGAVHFSAFALDAPQDEASFSCDREREVDQTPPASSVP